MHEIATAFACGGLSGSLITSLIFNHIHKSFINRLHVHSRLEEISEDLEIRRQTYDSEVDRDTDEGGLFATRPGALHLSQLATRLPENRWKTFDTGHISRTMNSEGVGQDQDMKTDEGQGN